MFEKGCGAILFLNQEPFIECIFSRPRRSQKEGVFVHHVLCIFMDNLSIETLLPWQQDVNRLVIMAR